MEVVNYLLKLTQQKEVSFLLVFHSLKATNRISMITQPHAQTMQHIWHLTTGPTHCLNALKHELDLAARDMH